MSDTKFLNACRLVRREGYTIVRKDELDGLRERLAAAEAVCLLFGWSPSHATTDREKAAYMLWCHWADRVGNEFTAPSSHPELSKDVIRTLARARDAIRDKTLSKIRGRDDEPEATDG